MKQFLKENIAIVAAIALPLALVLVFILSMSISNAVVDDPRHDFLIATNYYHNANDALRFDVIKNELQITYRYPQENETNHYNYNKNTRLWRVSVSDMSMEEIAVITPDQKSNEKSITFNIPNISELQFVNQQPAPDGYMFENSNHYRHGNIMTELFSYNRYYTTANLTKDGRTIPVKILAEQKYRYNTHFIGWILEAEE